ncbi:MAG: 50S ribosomal protein L37e [Candidatus Thermoplasmatota archaeon]|nr:50S ribosomal protein L37e [Candidatus Thermoplasmatota archaeon]
MSKGTPSRSGGKIVHGRCRRCGNHSYHLRKKKCSSCGFGDTSRMRSYSWLKQR